MPKKSKTQKPKVQTSDDAVIGTVELQNSRTDKDVLPDLSDNQRDSSTSDQTPSDRLQALFDVSHAYGERSFENYARIRSVAETVRNEFCKWLSKDPGCVFLVPPEGRFAAQNYQSAAFSVAGQGYLPLKPISFGLAVRVSEDKDFMRVKMTCRKEGEIMFVRLENGPEIEVVQPLSEERLTPLLEAIYAHLINFFQDRIDDYDNGRYGTQEIGFDIQRMNR